MLEVGIIYYVHWLGQDDYRWDRVSGPDVVFSSKNIEECQDFIRCKIAEYESL